MYCCGKTSGLRRIPRGPKKVIAEQPKTHGNYTLFQLVRMNLFRRDFRGRSIGPNDVASENFPSSLSKLQVPKSTSSDSFHNSQNERITYGHAHLALVK